MEIIVNDEAIRVMQTLREQSKKEQIPVVVLYSEIHGGWGGLKKNIGVEIQQSYEIKSHPEYTEYIKGKYPLPIYLDIQSEEKLPNKILLGTKLEYRGQVLTVVWNSHYPITSDRC